MTNHFWKVFCTHAVLSLYAAGVAAEEPAAMEAVVVEGTMPTTEPNTVELTPQQSAPTPDTASLVQRAAGGDVVSLGPVSGLAQYRGLSGPRVNVSVGGFNVKEVGPDGMSPPLSLMPSHMTHGVKVYRGIAPVRLGMETLGGQVSAEPMTGEFADDDKVAFHGEGSMGYTTVNSGWAGSLMTSVANRNHRFQMSGSREEGGDYEFEGNRAVRPSSYHRDAYGVGYGFRSDSGDELGLDYMDHATGASGTPTLPMDILFIQGGVSGVNYKKDLGNGMKLIASLHYQNMRHGMDNYTLRRPEMYWGIPQTMTMTHFSHTTVEGGGERVALAMPVADGELQLGVDADQSRHNMVINNSMPTAGSTVPDPKTSWTINNFKDVNRDRYSLFADWDGQLVRDWKGSFGLRYVYVGSSAGKVSDSMAEPGSAMESANVAALQNEFNASKRSNRSHNVDVVASLTHTFSDYVDLEIGFARKNRAPSYQELFLWIPDHSTGGLADGKVYLGNQDLRPEVAYQFELGLDWHTDKLHLAPRAFYHYVNDYIQGQAARRKLAIDAANDAMAWSSASRQVGVLQFANVDAQLFGADMEWGYAFTDHLHLDGTLSYVRGQRLDKKDNLYRMSPFHGNMMLSFHQRRWMVGLETVVYAGQGDVARYNDERKTPGYALVNLRGQYEPVDGLKLSAGIENLLDKEYRNHLTGLNQVVGNRDLPLFARVPGRGQNFFLTASYSW